MKVKIEIEDSIALNYELITEDQKVIDTIYRLDNKLKVLVTPSKPSDIISISEISLHAEYYNCQLGTNLCVYLIETIKKDRFAPYNPGRNVLTKNDYYFKNYGVLHCIEAKDKDIIRDYFKENGQSSGNLIQGITLEQFKTDLPNYYQKYLDNKGDSIIIRAKKVRKFLKSDDYINHNFIIDYNLLVQEN